MSSHKIVVLPIVIGAVCILLSLFLPWIRFVDPEVHLNDVQHLLSDPTVRHIYETTPQLRAIIGLESQQGGIAGLDKVFTDPDIQHIAAIAIKPGVLTGWSIWNEIPQINAALRYTFILIVCASLVSLVVIAIKPLYQWIYTQRVSRPILFVLAAIALLWMLWSVPIIDTFNIEGDLAIALVCSLTGAHAGIGMWVALLGTVFLSFGWLISLILPAPYSYSANEGF